MTKHASRRETGLHGNGSTMSKFLKLLCAPALVLFLTSFAFGQYATSILQYNQGGGSGVFTQSNILGAPSGVGIGGGSLNVLTLGTQGDVTVGFNTAIANGPGADFTVFENGFEFPPSFVFTELSFVEVSTDGLNFARFPNHYQGPQGPFGSFTTFPYGSSINLAGGMPVVANPATNNVDPLNPVFSGGDAFDLSDLLGHPLVVSGVLDLNDVNFVRIIDVEGGVDLDSDGRLIWDSTSSADIDAIAVLNTAASITGNRPFCGFSMDAQGYLHLTFSDPNGVMDLNGLSFMGSSNLVNFTPTQLLNVYDVFSVDAFSIDFRTKIPVVGLNLNIVAGVGILDNSGGHCFTQYVLPQ